MVDSCLFCETEPIEDSDWFKNEKTLEVICPWCVKDISNMVHKLRNLGDRK